MTVVVGSGEKGRTVIGTFASASATASATATTTATEAPPAARASNKTTHPTGSKAVITLGAAMAVSGTALAIWGITKVPAGCAISTHQCAAPPGDPAFEDAAAGVRLTNIGFALTGIGVVALTGGLYWYFKRAKTPNDNHVVATPWATPDGAGFVVSGRM